MPSFPKRYFVVEVSVLRDIIYLKYFMVVIGFTPELLTVLRELIWHPVL